MSEIILAALLREWLDYLVIAIETLEALPPLKDGRQKVIIEDLPEMANLRSLRDLIEAMIDKLEGGTE